MINFKRTKKIDFREFINGSHNEKPSFNYNICKSSFFSLSPVYVQNGDILYYGLMITAGTGIILVCFSFIEHLTLKSGGPSVFTVVLDGIQKALPIVFTGVLIYLIYTMPIWRWI